EQKQDTAEERGEEQRAGDVAPVVPRVPAQAFSCLAPLRLDPVQGGQEYQHHERDLEVEIDEVEAGDLEQPQVVLVEVEAVALGKQVDEAGRPDAGDERKRKRDASELREHP